MFVKEVDEYKTEVKYSYYAILILDTVQPIVNSSQYVESGRKSWKLMEGATSFYVILRHTSSYESGLEYES